MSKEVWKDIKGFEGYYQVSNLGRVKSVEREEEYARKDSDVITKRIRKEKILKQKVIKDGYMEVNLWKDGNNKYFRVHRLVATAFIPNPENKPVVNHKDGDTSNNKVENLEWNTVSENTWHATHILGTNKVPLQKATEACKKKTIILNTLTDETYEFDSRKDAEVFFKKEFREIVGSRQRKQFKHLKLINEED